MPHAIEFMNPEFCQRLTLTLMHMLWVGTAIGIVTLTANQCLKRATARLRYAVNVMGLLVLLASLPVTYGIVTTSRRDHPASSHGFRMLSPDDPLAVAARHAGLSKIITVDGAFAIPATEVTSLRMIAPYMTACYLAGLAILLGRLTILFGNTSRIRRCATPVDDATLLEQLRQIADRLGLRRIPTLAWSERVGVPSIVGIVRPIILLPMRLATGLGPDEMRAVITHELAHIRRYDPLMHLVQRLAESLLFFHPFVWIISRRVSIERENCCDDAVLASGWQPVDYANSLVRLAELCSVGSTSDLDNRPLALAATGDGSSAFSGRIHRLLGLPPVSRLRPYRSGSLAVAVTGAAVVVAAMLQPVQQTLGEGGSEANELKLTFSGDSKH
ncbi:MAG: M56 family metallopeptidase, partial [Planctomycetaceae bacterium]